VKFEKNYIIKYKMKILIFIILLLGVYAESLTKTNACICAEIKSSNDCIQLT
jgi:hypothetical protein